MWDKISDVEFRGDGKVVSNYILEKRPNEDEPFRRFRFESAAAYDAWRQENSKKWLTDLKKKLTPHQIYITQGKGMERAFTGEYWWTNDVGKYSCACCGQKLFMYDHKYINKSGYPTFWNSLENAVRFVSDAIKINTVTNAHEDPALKGKMPVKRATCSNVSNCKPML